MTGKPLAKTGRWRGNIPAFLFAVACGLLFCATASAGGRAATPFSSMHPAVRMAYPEVLYGQPDFGLEWWYLTGHLADGAARYGFELTFFRVGVSRAPAEGPFSLRDVHLAHFAVTDLSRGRFLYAERSSRGAFGEAGARPDRLETWNGPWRLHGDGARLYLEALEPGFALRLELRPLKPPTFHGDGGYSQKGPDPAEASFYMSLTRLEALGRLRIDETEHAVQGTAWMDREITTPVSRATVRGWDWFALQLDDGRELMLYRIDDGSGAVSLLSAGTVVAADGTPHRLGAGDFETSARGRWTSPATGIRYDTDWDIAVPGLGLRLRVTAELDDQELVVRRSTGNAYWEGACRVTGRQGDTPVTGRAYVEMNRQGTPAGPRD